VLSTPGLVPFWTKRNPDYGSKMKTINCRDDSLIEDRGMWTTMKKKKRCIVIAQGFFEWLKSVQFEGEWPAVARSATLPPVVDSRSCIA
jgi:putative SOS response-associated peptidase YedK